MKKTDTIMIDELNPYVRKVGVQGIAEWGNTYRKIYDHEWMYCIKGKAYYSANGVEHELTKGSLLLIKPNIPHGFWKDKENPAEIIWVHFDFKYRRDVHDLENLIKDNQNIYFNEELPEKNYLRQDYKIENRFFIPEIFKINKTSYVEDRFKDILKAFDQHHITWQLGAKANLLLIIKEVIYQMTEENNLNSKYNNENLIDYIKSYINQYYFRKITRKEISKYLGYNEDYIGKFFKNKEGISISQYLNDIRIEKAKELLDKTDFSVTNIAELIGFLDIYYFSKTMKNITGYSPNEWRCRNV
ncbi:AraC family transcriptional regulator [Clostridium grantii]|uniref:AraC-like ligand binding domain-containing protein n=1 Tax=Clostridium grantii DSM 8605 TaxID=1121316 RepID=A0A1M5VU30_9CLOT|nr:helix-turn-helix domain-containing protein [Clostridium grantii]SHH78731.1 AraC-like ligand binding domain-containing protein [Clostridium grantii DSM 8605]